MPRIIGKELQILTNATATGAGTVAETSPFRRATITINAASVSTGATVDIEYRLPDGSWVVHKSQPISANGNNEITIELNGKTGIRPNISSYTDGTYNAWIQVEQ